VELGLASVRIGGGDQSFTERDAPLAKRTREAPRAPRDANNRTKVDESQRELAASTPRQELGQRSPHARVLSRSGSCRRHTESSSQEPDHVWVEEGPPSSEGDDEYSVRDVAPHPRQRPEIAFAAGNTAAEAVEQHPPEVREAGASMKQAERPESVDDLGGISLGKRAGIWVAANEAFEYGGYQVGASTLEQQLRNEHGIGIVGDAPRERAPLLVEPRQHATAEPPPLRLINGQGVARRKHGSHVVGPLGSCALESNAPWGARAAVRSA